MAHPYHSNYCKVGSRHTRVRPQELVAQLDHRSREAHAGDRVAVRIVIRVRETSRARDDCLVKIEGLEAGEGEQEEKCIGGGAGEDKYGERYAWHEGLCDQGCDNTFEATSRE